jgi:hypothetical protein
MKLAGVAALALAVSSCGGGSRPSPPPPSTGGPSTPPGVTRVTGSERIAWNQGGDLTGLRFLAFVDDNSVALDQAACNASGECSSPLPPMNDGTHTIAMAAVAPGGGTSGRSQPITVEKVSARSVASATFTAGATSGTAAAGAGTLTVAGGAAFQAEIVARSLASPVQMDAAADGRLLVADAAGGVSVVHPAANERLNLALEARTLLRPAPSGPIGLALHPDFATNRFAYVSFIAEDGPGRRILRVVRLREAGDTLGEPATLFETPLRIAANAPNGGPRMAFGPDHLLHLLLPRGSAFDDQRVTGRPDGSMARLDEHGRVAVSIGGDAVDPLGFGWHPLTSTLWGLVPQAEGDVMIRPMGEGVVAGVRELWSGPRLAVAADQSVSALVFRHDAAAIWTGSLARAFHPGDLGTIRLAAPIAIDGLIDGVTGRVTDVVSAGGALYVAIDGFRTVADATPVPGSVIVRVREP